MKRALVLIILLMIRRAMRFHQMRFSAPNNLRREATPYAMSAYYDVSSLPPLTPSNELSPRILSGMHVSRNNKLRVWCGLAMTPMRLFGTML